MPKRRLTITIDTALTDAAAAAVAAGTTRSVSAWINEAMAQRVARDNAGRANLGDLVRAYEDEHGEITGDDLAEQARADRDAAASVRRTRAS